MTDACTACPEVRLSSGFLACGGCKYAQRGEGGNTMDTNKKLEIIEKYKRHDGDYGMIIPEKG